MWRLVKNKSLLALIVAFGAILLLDNHFAFASTTIQANICRTSYVAPLITEPAQAMETKDLSITVKGTGEPNMTVTIVNNGVNAGAVTVGSDGSFALQVPLAVGDNTLIARETDGCTTQDSGAVNIHRTAVPPPEQPTIPPQYGGVITPSADNESTLSPTMGGTSLVPDLSSPATPPPSGQRGSGIVILRPRDGTRSTDGQIWVRGRAPAGSVVTIFLNDREVARIVAADDGSFAAMITLRPGDNTIQATAESDGRSVSSQEITVHFNKGGPAENPIKLSEVIGATILFGVLAVTIIFLWRCIRRKREPDV